MNHRNFPHHQSTPWTTTWMVDHHATSMLWRVRIPGRHRKAVEQRLKIYQSMQCLGFSTTATSVTMFVSIDCLTARDVTGDVHDGFNFASIHSFIHSFIFM